VLIRRRVWSVIRPGLISHQASNLPVAPLHVTNGESAAGSLRATGLEGEVLSWDDVLHVGPLAFDPSESRPLRAAFLAQYGWDAGEIRALVE
jgi:hypothetical protein